MQSTNAPRITKTKCSCCREIMTVCPESNSEHENTLCKQKAEIFLMLTVVVYELTTKL